MDKKLEYKERSFSGLSWLKMSSSNSNKINKKQAAATPSPYSSSGSDCSPVIPRRRHSDTSHRSRATLDHGTGRDADTDEADGILSYKGSPSTPRQYRLFGDSYSLHNPKNAQNLQSLLLQPGTKELLTPAPDVDNPFHTLIRQPRSDKDKVDLLVTFLTHSSVDVLNAHGKGGMTPLHYAVQANSIVSIKALLAFGADVNLINSRQHTSLDIATFLWITHESHTKINIGTNNLETVKEHKHQLKFKSLPDVTSPPLPLPFLKRSNIKLVSRTSSSSSWVYVDEGSSDSSSCGESMADESSDRSTEDTRDFTHSVMPIKYTDLTEEVLSDTTCTSQFDIGSSLLKSIGDILELLYSCHAQSGNLVVRRFNKVPLLSSFSESDEFKKKIDEKINPFTNSNDIERSLRIKDFLEGRTVFSLYEELEFNINMRLESKDSLSVNPDEAIALAFQQKEMVQFKKTEKPGIGFMVNGGSRLLFLDGGGIKGLVQIEVMRQIEEATGRKIIELFDWIIGSSIGGILALGLVYAKKSLKELQQMCFKLKEDVFVKPRAGFAFNTKAMEKMITDEFGHNMTMNSIKKPKVLIAAVNKRMAPAQLHFFNNCFSDKYSNTPVWKVARYTSAAPMFFTEFEDYVDGGVLANNPCDYGLTAIQNFHRLMEVDLPISMVISIGTGVFPPEELGRIDAQEFLFFGKHWFNFSDTLKSRTQNLLSLLTNALVESEIVAKNCRVRCHEQKIPYYRFSPQLNHVIAAGETDNEKLLDMMLQTRIQSSQQGLSELPSLFHLIANASKKTNYRQSRVIAENDS